MGTSLMRRAMGMGLFNRQLLIPGILLALMVRFGLEKWGVPALLEPHVHLLKQVFDFLFALSIFNLLVFAGYIFFSEDPVDEAHDPFIHPNNWQDHALVNWVKSLVFTAPLALYGAFLYVIIHFEWKEVGLYLGLWSLYWAWNTYMQKHHPRS